jgi:putative tricarboxylic transport membrane protein
MGRDAVTGLVVLAASLALFWGTLGLERHPMVPVGPEFYPRIIAAVMALLAASLIAVDVVAHRRGLAKAAQGPRPRYALVAIAFAIFAAYVLAMPYVGFRASTFVFLLAMQCALERPATRRRWIAVLLVALLTTLVTHFLFEGYLKVLLPRGRWTGF